MFFVRPLFGKPALNPADSAKQAFSSRLNRAPALSLPSHHLLSFAIVVVLVVIVSMRNFGQQTAGFVVLSSESDGPSETFELRAYS